MKRVFVLGSCGDHGRTERIVNAFLAVGAGRAVSVAPRPTAIS